MSNVVKKPLAVLDTPQIQDWLNYWAAAKMVAVEQIRAFDQVHQARNFCQCMRVGVFHPDLVTDLQIWRAIEAMRASSSIAA